MSELSHLSGKGEMRMVDISGKEATERVASARAFVSLNKQVCSVLRGGDLPKGDALAACRLAGIMASKKTSDLIPLCHPLALTSVEVEVSLVNDGAEITSVVKTSGRTGVEMEALVAVTVAALTLYDMCKSLDKGILIREVGLVSKSGGRSGNWPN